MLTGYRPLYTMMSHLRPLAALKTDGALCCLWSHYKFKGRFLALQYNGGPLCGPFPIFSMHPEFGESTLVFRLVLAACRKREKS